VLLALGFVLACAAQPLRGLLPATLPAMLALLAAVLVATVAGFVPLAAWAQRTLAMPATRGLPLRGNTVLVALLLLPLFFTWFTMTAEVTLVIEKGVTEAWGLE
jgi:hypothetical protein